MNNGKENTESTKAQTRKLEVSEWVNINIDKWRAWGFKVDEIYRTPKYNFLIQPVKSELNEQLEPGYGLILSGAWYPLDEKTERTLEKTIWIAWFMEVLLLALALLVYTKGQTFLSLGLFFVMYLILEGFFPLSYRKYASGKFTGNVSILAASLKKVTYFEKSGTILMSWGESGKTFSTAFRMSVNRAEALVGRIKGHVNPDVKVTFEANLNPMSYPATKKNK